MIRGVYDAGAALQSASLNQEILAENLAHATTTGYRRQGLLFETLVGKGGPNTTGQVSGAGAYTSFEPGSLQQTGNPYDVALTGDAFFVLQGPSGPVYSRNGAFEVNEHGDLQTRSGMRVSGQGGPITIPEGALNVQITGDGAIMADGAQVGQLKLAHFDDPQKLHRVGTTMYEGSAPRDPEPGSVHVEQGYREGSNVQVVQEMVSMMLGMRQYEAAERALRALGESVALNTKPQA